MFVSLDFIYVVYHLFILLFCIIIAFRIVTIIGFNNGGCGGGVVVVGGGGGILLLRDMLEFLLFQILTLLLFSKLTVTVLQLVLWCL